MDQYHRSRARDELEVEVGKVVQRENERKGNERKGRG